MQSTAYTSITVDNRVKGDKRIRGSEETGGSGETKGKGEPEGQGRHCGQEREGSRFLGLLRLLEAQKVFWWWLAVSKWI